MRKSNMGTRARRALACVLALVLAAGLAPAPLGASQAWAEESQVVLELGERPWVEQEDTATGESDLEEVGVQTPEGADAASEKALTLDMAADNETGVEVQDSASGVTGPRMKADSNMDSGQVVTWDCVWFGSYPQSEVTPGDDAYASLKSASWNADGEATVGGVRYRRVTKSDAASQSQWQYDEDAVLYFRCEPIKWRVLKVSGTTALVVADMALDDRFYNTEYAGVTWEFSSVRSWLNGYGADSNQPQTDFVGKGFIDAAFSSSERSAILQSDVVNAKSMEYSTPGGNDTKDMVFLLSEEEIYNTAYGFANTWSIFDEARRCNPTDYACAMGVQKEAEGSYEGNCFWWLRSPGGQAMFAVYVGSDGYVNQNGRIVDYASHAVRPALNLNLASPHSQAAGTVSSDGSVSELPPAQGPITITSVSLDATVFSYDGMAKRPTVTVRSGDQIVPSSGYDVAYKDNVNAGTATVTVTGKDDYMGTLTATFAIKPAGLSSAKVSGVTNKTYNGMAQTQKPTVKVGSRTLKEGTDYTLSYNDNKKAGTATLTVTGKGNYTGSASKAFQIAKAANPMKVKGVKRAVKAAKVKQKAQVVARPIKFTKNARGEVTYKRVSAGSSKSLTVNQKTGKVTVKKGTKKGTYKVKIQVTAKGTANYKKAAKTLTCTVVVM